MGVPSKEVVRIGESVHQTSERGGFIERIESFWVSVLKVKVPSPGRESAAEGGLLLRSGASVRK